MARWAVRIALALLLLAALAWGVLHWAIVPRIDQLRPRLERLATRWVGAPVSIGAISAESNGLTPVIELTGVTVHDAQGRAGLAIARAQVAFSITSLLRGGVEQLALDGPQLDIRRTAQGRLLIGGLDISGDASGDTRAADWFFAQPEFVVQGGAVRWIDDTRPDMPPVALSNLRLVIRNGRLHHQLRLDATPDSAWGAPFTLTGQFRQPIFARHPGRWRDWNGQAYALLPRVDVSRLRQYVDLRADWGVEVTQGQGALRLWLDARRGQITGITADLALGAVTATLGPELEPLALTSLSGRVGWQKHNGREEITTRNLRFADRDGLIWPGGNFQLSFQDGGAGGIGGGTLEAEQLDLGVLAKIARRLPLPRQVHEQLALHPVAGRVETIQAHWTGSMDAPRNWQVSARASDLTVGAQALPSKPDGKPRAGIPGIEGAQLTVQATPAGGQADLTIKDGALTFPGVFERPRIALQTLTARAQWTVNAQTGQIAVDVPQAAFANADATGHLRANWHTATGQGDARFPGVLDLDGVITRADGARVWRYLPLHIPQAARDY
ncbi:MAG: TIGR02099 family protein, partial [Burkholderiaceae bacterium]|nr:TIGR02099 family protein [Burkholderiaceae bacterium]